MPHFNIFDAVGDWNPESCIFKQQPQPRNILYDNTYTPVRLPSVLHTEFPIRLAEISLPRLRFHVGFWQRKTQDQQADKFNNQTT